MPVDLSDEAITRAFNGLTAIVSHFLHDLPGATKGMDEFARQALSHAAATLRKLRDELVAGVRNPQTEQLFAGLALLVYPAGEVAVEASLSQ